MSPIRCPASTAALRRAGDVEHVRRRSDGCRPRTARAEPRRSVFPGAHGVRCQVGQCGHSSNRVQAFFFFAHGCLGSVELCDQDPVVY